MTECDPIENHQVLMNLSHVSHVRNDRQAELPGQQTDHQKLASTCQPGANCLDEMNCAAAEEILEQNAVGNMLARGNANRSDRAGKFSMSVNVVRMCGLLDPQRLKGGHCATRAQRFVRVSTLVGIKHQDAGVTDDFPQHGSPAQVPIYAVGANLEFESAESALYRI